MCQFYSVFPQKIKCLAVQETVEENALQVHLESRLGCSLLTALHLD
jgi:hypothetical protein